MNYPNNIKKISKNYISHKNRGMDLESDLNLTNEYYIEIDKALIYKKPTPIGVSKVSFKDGSKIIDKAYFKEPSTLDYNGLYKGKYIEFEAKVTKNTTSFPLSNIHKHQIEHLKKVINHGGIVFLIIKINNLVYLLKGEDLVNFIINNNRQSIPYHYIEEKGYLINYGFRPILDYLKIVDYLFFKEEEK